MRLLTCNRPQIPALLIVSALCSPGGWAQPAAQPDVTTQELSISSSAAADSTVPAPTDIDADTEARCFSEAVRLSGDTAWCDVLISALNAKLPPAPETTAALVRSYHNRSLLLVQRGELDLAEADLLAALRLQPEYPALSLAMGNLRLRQGRFNEALESYNDAIERSRQPPPAFFVNRALALRGLGQIQLAADDVARARAMRQDQARGTQVNPSDSDAAPGVEFR
jgi:tetratricopeptide (TPR) repeat protein